LPSHLLVAAPLRIGPITVATPVVLAPMAGVTNRAFRQLCREAASATGFAPGLFVAEMVTARALVEGNRAARKIVTFGSDEDPRSAQVYGVDPVIIAAAVEIICAEDRADHIDLNFGCPVPKVTRKGGGGALPWKTRHFAAVVRAAVAAAEPYRVPVTVKMRTGIDPARLTYLDAGPIAAAEGAAAITLHARTVDQRYSGRADWAAIARLKEAVPDVPILGNGDVFTAEDALAMLRQTGCDGVVVGRGAQGRPWLFADLTAALHGSPDRVRPTLPQVAAVILRHGELQVRYAEDEGQGMRDLRKHMAWYLKGYPVGGAARRELAMVSSLAELRERLAALGDAPYPGEVANEARGRQGSAKAPHLPYGWLDSRELSERDRALVMSASADDADGG